MNRHYTFRTLLFLLFVNDLMSYDLHHKRQLNAMEENHQIQQENDMTEAEENLDKKYFEGDILTTPAQMKKIYRLFHHHDTTTPHVRGIVKDVRKTWPNGVVYYKFSELLGPDKRQMIKDAMEHWKLKTCLQFKERKAEKDYVRFETGLGCASFVGRMGGGQRLVVGDHCMLGNVIHEIGHAVGFFHEMSRPDRDGYVKIIWKNILPNRERNFQKYNMDIIDSRDVQYDYGSIMHYSKLHFTKDREARKNTILPKDEGASIGQRIGLSDLDIKQAKLLYNCGQGHQNTMMPDSDMDPIGQ